MSKRPTMHHVALMLGFLCLSIACGFGCGGGAESSVASRTRTGSATGQVRDDGREAPPASGPFRDVSFPKVTRFSLENELGVHAVRWNLLPIVYLRLVIGSGSASDPEGKPGMAQFVTSMLKEGTKTRSSDKLAEEVEFLGADLETGSDSETVYIQIRVLKSQLEPAMALLADVAMRPAFAKGEVNKLKKRELDRLKLQENDPNFLAAKAFYSLIYGEHAYANLDTFPQVVKGLKVPDLRRWHETRFVPRNATLVAVGDVEPKQLEEMSKKAFGAWSSPFRDEAMESAHTKSCYSAIPDREKRAIVVVDRPKSVQSTIMIGHASIPYRSKEYVPLLVANQVLGGSAASRLFMDLREKRSLTYGAYSGITERVDKGTFRASAAVRSEVTREALDGFFEHLDRIVKEPPSDEEHANAQRYLSDRFPLQIDTPAKIASMVADLKIHGLPKDYWDTYRSKIRSVSLNQAHEGMKTFVHPDKALVVIVGDKDKILPQLEGLETPTVLTPQEVTGPRGFPGAGCPAKPRP